MREFLGELFNKSSMSSSLRDLEAASKYLRLEGVEIARHLQQPGC